MDSIKPKVQIEGGMLLIVHEKLGTDFRGPVLVGKAGSGRMYYRIWSKGQSLVLMQSHQRDEDFDRFIECSKYLKNNGLPVPGVLGFNHSHFQVLLEDLGDETLLHRVEAEKKIDKALYHKSLELLVDFQEKGHQNITSFAAVGHRNFGYLDLLWETEYFYDHFLSRYVRLIPNEKKRLFEFFESLALSTDRHLRALMHRDFQSQNLMVIDNEIHLIDYQGMRMGSIYYDVASLLWDPYTELSQEEIKELFAYYLDQKGIEHSHQEWERFVEAALQRVMQACGAYGYLSQIVGIKEFAQYLDAGFRTLKNLATHCSSIDASPLIEALEKVNEDQLK